MDGDVKKDFSTLPVKISLQYIQWEQNVLYNLILFAHPVLLNSKSIIKVTWYWEMRISNRTFFPLKYAACKTNMLHAVNFRGV